MDLPICQHPARQQTANKASTVDPCVSAQSDPPSKELAEALSLASRTLDDTSTLAVKLYRPLIISLPMLPNYDYRNTLPSPYPQSLGDFFLSISVDLDPFPTSHDIPYPNIVT